MADSYPFSMSPQSVSSGKGIVGVMNENAAFQKEMKIVRSTPDFAKSVDPSALTQYSKQR
jgi:hypothetical protein